MTRQKNQIRTAAVFLIVGAVFFGLTYFSNTVLTAYDVSSVRPSAAMNPVLGIAFGWPAILSCTAANFVSDLLAGYGLAVSVIGLFSQTLYGALPWFVWRAFVGCESHLTRLDSPKKTLYFALLMAFNSMWMGLAVGGFQLYFTGGQFWESAWFAFLNDFDMCMIFGLPMMAVIDWCYSRFRHTGKRRAALNEKIILITAAMQVAAFGGIVAVSALPAGGADPRQLWQLIFTRSATVINGLLILSAAAMCLFTHLQKKHAGLRIFERENGTIYADEKRRLEFVSFPAKEMKYRVKADFLGYNYEDTRQAMQPSYERAWYMQLSAQKGCSMRCAFCDCPAYGFYGNASLEDLCYQVETILKNSGSARTDYLEVDLTRMGEPTMNPAVLEFLEFHLQNLVRSRVDAGVIYPTLSTMMPRNLKDLGAYLQEFCRIKNEVYNGSASLQLDVDTTDDAARRKLFRSYSLPLEEIAAIAGTLPAPRGMKYALGFTVTRDSIIDAAVIDRLFDREKFLIRLTPLHQTFNALDNGYQITSEYEDFEVYRVFESQFRALGWDVMVCLDSAEEDRDGLTCGNLLLSHITEKIRPRPTAKKKVGLLVAIEMDAIFKRYPNWKELDAPAGFKLFLIERQDHVLYVLQCGMGEVVASAGVQHLISKCGVSLIVNFGVVGGLTNDMSSQKVCLVDRVVHYKYDLSEFADVPVGQVDGHDTTFLKTTESLVKYTRGLRPDLPVVTCCSGDKFVGTAAEKSFLHQTFGGDICDMEAAGVVLTCETNRVPCLMIKAVADGLSDGADGFYTELQNASIRCLETVDQVMERIVLLES